jgi:hypothetical protein
MVIRFCLAIIQVDREAQTNVDALLRPLMQIAQFDRI